MGTTVIQYKYFMTFGALLGNLSVDEWCYLRSIVDPSLPPLPHSKSAISLWGWGKGGDHTKWRTKSTHIVRRKLPQTTLQLGYEVSLFNNIVRNSFMDVLECHWSMPYQVRVENSTDPHGVLCGKMQDQRRWVWVKLFNVWIKSPKTWRSQ